MLAATGLAAAQAQPARAHRALPRPSAQSAQHRPTKGRPPADSPPTPGDRSPRRRRQCPRSRETCICSALRAVAGGRSPHSSSIRRSTETHVPARNTSAARTRRDAGPGKSTGWPLRQTSNGPRTRNSSIEPRADATSDLRAAPCESLPAGGRTRDRTRRSSRHAHHLPNRRDAAPRARTRRRRLDRRAGGLPTGVFATTLVRVEIPRVVRTGLGDMTTGAPQRSAISTPARTPGCASRRPFDWPRP